MTQRETLTAEAKEISPKFQLDPDDSEMIDRVVEAWTTALKEAAHEAPAI